MKKTRKHFVSSGSKAKVQGGFTIIEIMVAMTTAAVLMMGCISSYYFLMDTQRKNKKITKQHRKLRGPLQIAALNIQAAGRGGLQPRTTALYGVMDVTPKDLDGNDDPNGYPALIFNTLIEDRDGNNRIDDGDNPPYTYTWRLTDYDGDGGVMPDLIRIEDDNAGNLGNGGVRREDLIARNVENIGFAFATDQERDQVLDQHAGATQWAAYSSDASGWLDIQLDANSDGVIDGFDDVNLDGVIDGGDNPAADLGTLIPLIRIRQVKMYILVRSERRDPNYVNKNTYVLGPTVVHPFPKTDPQKRFQFHRQVLTIGLSVRNRESELQL